MANYTLSTLPSSLAVGDTITVSYTGSAQSYTFLKNYGYTIECWGAQGGSTTRGDSIGGYGGYVKGSFTPTSDTLYYLFVGGKGTDSPYNTADYGSVVGGAGGYNGGGAGGGGYGAGGGGCTAVCSTSSMSNTSCLLIAGGGGGTLSASSYGNYANARASGTTANIYSSSSYIGASGSYGTIGCYYYDTFGGGGGYYGGATVSSDDAEYAYGGVNYISSTLTNTGELSGSSATWTGNGQIVITITYVPPQIFIKTSSTEWTSVDSIYLKVDSTTWRGGSL